MQVKPKKCKACRQPFIPRSSLHRLCSMECAIADDMDKKDKKARKVLLAGRIKLKSLTDWLRDAQAVFNKWIRHRDGNFCISCQMVHTGQIHAGHYRTTKAASQLRYNEDNVSSQCAPCNNHLSGNITEYRINLVKKIGVERVEALESNNVSHRYTVDEAKEIIKTYKARLKEGL